jgi:aspartate aminotransferase
VDFKLAERVGRIKPSPTLAVTARAQQLRAAGKDVIGLGAGEPDFATPEHICEAAIAAIRDGFTHYTAVDGIPELKAAIAAKFRNDNDIEYAPEQILVSTGAKQTLYNLCQALLNDGDEVVIPAPYWVSYPAMALLADATPVFVSAGPEQRFKIVPEQLEAALTPRTKLLFLNSPSNPAGTAYTRAELEALAEVLRAHPQVVIATDDMYEHIYWAEEPFCSLLTCAPHLYDRTVTINGVSKAYAMTGWRIGYCGGPEPLVKAMKKVQSQSTSNPCGISQKAAVAALAGDQGPVKAMTAQFKKRHDYLAAALDDLPAIDCLAGDATFYLFPDVRGAIEHLDGVNDDTEFAEFLLEKAGVAVVPGVAFGAPGHVRFSFASSMETLQEAMRRIREALV